jgi:hypothetical protein
LQVQRGEPIYVIPSEARNLLFPYAKQIPRLTTKPGKAKTGFIRSQVSGFAVRLGMTSSGE